jgi:hypothetical protein
MVSFRCFLDYDIFYFDLDVNTELVRVALAYALSRNEIQFIQSLIPTARRIRPYLELAKLFARMFFLYLPFFYSFILFRFIK